MREIYGFLRLASRLANPFGHPSQVRTQVLVLQTCVDLARALGFHESMVPYSCYCLVGYNLQVFIQIYSSWEQKLGTRCSSCAVGPERGLQGGKRTFEMWTTVSSFWIVFIFKVPYYNSLDCRMSKYKRLSVFLLLKLSKQLEVVLQFAHSNCYHGRRNGSSLGLFGEQFNWLAPKPCYLKLQNQREAWYM